MLKRSPRALACFGILVFFNFISPSASGVESDLWKQFVADSDAGKETLLPDYSYAGYEHGEVPIPDKKGVVFNVIDYGAVPDDDKPDAEAIQKAIDACEKAGGGVVLFPKGVFIINDKSEDATKPRLNIKSSGIVLRGAGSGADGTVLYSPAQMLPEDPNQMWTGRVPILISGPGGMRGPKVKVLEPAPKGGKILKVPADANFKPGERIVLLLKRPGKLGESFVAPRVWPEEWTAGIDIRELHEIKSVSPGQIELAEPLMIAVDNQGDWSLSRMDFISQIGVEDIRFRGAWKEKFVHHKDWRNDSAWRGITMTRCENSWVRRCVFEDMNWVLLITRSRQMTVEDVEFVGTPGHFGMQVIGTYGILGLKVRDNAGHHHGPSLQAGACSTVYHECLWSPKKSFDSHANNSYSTLHDQNEGGLNLAGVGGSISNFPHHLHDFVLWNFKVTETPPNKVSFWDVGTVKYARSFVQVIISGIHGAPFTLEAESVYKNESPGAPVTPASLWLAQVARRFGKIPDHFKAYGTDANP